MYEQFYAKTLNIKERKLLELQITQTRHTIGISDGKMSEFNTRKHVKLFIKCAQNRRCTSSMCEQSLFKI